MVLQFLPKHDQNITYAGGKMQVSGSVSTEAAVYKQLYHILQCHSSIKNRGYITVLHACLAYMYSFRRKKKVQVGKDRKRRNQKDIPTPKIRGGKKPN